METRPGARETRNTISGEPDRLTTWRRPPNLRPPAGCTSRWPSTTNAGPPRKPDLPSPRKGSHGEAVGRDEDQPTGLERASGIEPLSSAWKAEARPLDQARVSGASGRDRTGALPLTRRALYLLSYTGGIGDCPVDMAPGGGRWLAGIDPDASPPCYRLTRPPHMTVIAIIAPRYFGQPSDTRESGLSCGVAESAVARSSKIYSPRGPLMRLLVAPPIQPVESTAKPRSP